jgi:tRNA U34 5-methylaminomethyl-2-thiouridine-forming methyltransferase MnmC
MKKLVGYTSTPANAGFVRRKADELGFGWRSASSAAIKRFYDRALAPEVTND